MCKCGVDVWLVVDEKNNIEEDCSGKVCVVLGVLRNVGVDVWVILVYFIYYDKVIVVDWEMVELGSFNYLEVVVC